MAPGQRDRERDLINYRRRVIRQWQSGEVSPGFCRGSAVRLPWPAQRERADRSLAVENIRRAYYDWKINRRKAR